jgi:hypothetical protein
VICSSVVARAENKMKRATKKTEKREKTGRIVPFVPTQANNQEPEGEEIKLGRKTCNLELQ